MSSGITNLENGNIYQFQGAVYPQGEFPCVKDVNTGATIVTPACTLTLPVGPPAFNRNYRYNDGAVYAQDSIKLLPRFTLNLGVRWEYYGPQHNANPNLDSNLVLGSGSNIFEQIRGASVQLSKNGGVVEKPRYHNFGPRIGFAWDIFGDGKTALRGGYAIGYERNFGNVTFNAIQNPPNYAVISLTSNQDVPGFLPVFTDTAGPLAGTGTKALPQVSQRAINQDLHDASAKTWDLAIEHKVGRGLIAVSYSGSHGLHLYDIANINPFQGGGIFLGDTHFNNRINLQYSNINYRSDNAYSHYNSVNVKYAVTNLGNKGLGITANYTFSHSLDNLSSTFSDGSPGLYQLGYIDAFNPTLNYGNSDYDIRHRLSLAWTWDVPYFKSSSSALARNILGGWGMGSILSIRSGSPFSVYDCSNAITGCPLYVPDATIARTGSSTPVGINLFNYIALPSANPTPGYVVDNGGDSLQNPNCTGLFHVGCTYTLDGRSYPLRNQFFGPGFWNLDASFYKTFKLTERFGLQFRGEFYNIFNHHNQYVTTGNLDVSSLSSPFIQTERGGPGGSAGNPTDERRNIQLALRLTF